jgi:hypothetical protein
MKCTQFKFNLFKFTELTPHSNTTSRDVLAGYLEKEEFKEFLQKQAKDLPIPIKRGRGRPPGR